jgi:hypothetical protein
MLSFTGQSARLPLAKTKIRSTLLRQKRVEIKVVILDRDLRFAEIYPIYFEIGYA